MSWFSTLMGRIRGRLSPEPLDPFWYDMAAPITSSGVSVTGQSALTYSAVFAATRLLSNGIGTLPLNLHKRRPGGGSDIQHDDPRHWLVHTKPNDEMPSMLWRCTMAQQQINGGNAYAEIQRNGNRATGLWPVHPSRVEVKRNESGMIFYLIKNEGKPSTRVAAADMLHIPSSMTDDGICGKGILANARESIGYGLATEQHGASIFGDGAIPKAVITGLPKGLMADESHRKQFRKEWREVYGGANGEKIALMGEGAKLEAIGFNAEESQLLEMRQFNIEEIARWYNVPPHKLQHLLRATFSNIEHLGIEFVQDSLVPWLKLWEEKLDAALLSEAERATHYFKFNVTALLRGDSAARAAFYQSLINIGVMSPNEARALEDLNPYDGGDQYLIQGAMIPIDDAGTEEPEPEPEEPPENGGNLAQIGEEIDELRAENRLLAGRIRDMSANFEDSLADISAQSDVATLEKRLDLADEQAQTAAWQGFEAALSGIVRRHAAHARRAMSSSSFIDWIDGYSTKYRDNCESALSGPASALAACGIPIDAADIVAEHFARAKVDLLEASGVPRDRFEIEVEARLVDWEQTGAAELAEYAFRER